MTRWTALLLMLLSIAVMPGSARQSGDDERRALRARLESRYDVVPLTDGIALRPKTRTRDLRLIEISDNGIAVNGEPVSGAELRERIGTEDADLVLRVSYLSDADRKALFAPAEVQPPVEAPAPPPAGEDRTRERRRRSSGDRVRIFGNVHVSEGEEIGGQAVAVMGSVRVEGEVGQDVVAVLGSVELGPRAVVDGDVVSVGGRVHRAAGAVVRGGVTEVAFTDPDWTFRGNPWIGTWAPFFFVNEFGAVTRLVGTVLRLMLLVIVGLLAMVVARPTVESAAARISDNPLKATIIGLAAEVLFLPVWVIASILIAITVIGIPLLIVLTPVVILLVIVMAVVGFTGAAAAIGQWARRRFGIGTGSPAADLCLGIFIVLLPLLVGRALAVAGWPVTPFAWMFVTAGFCFELLVWASGFGAVLANAFSRWQARRVTAVTPS